MAVSRVLSSPRRTEKIIYLSDLYPELTPLARNEADHFVVPYLALHPMGFSVPPLTYVRGGGPLPHLFTLTDSSRSRRSQFLRHFPSNGPLEPPARVYPSSRRVTRHRVLRCSDFPPPVARERSSAVPGSKNKTTLRSKVVYWQGLTTSCYFDRK